MNHYCPSTLPDRDNAGWWTYIQRIGPIIPFKGRPWQYNLQHPDHGYFLGYRWTKRGAQFRTRRIVRKVLKEANSES